MGTSSKTVPGPSRLDKPAGRTVTSLVLLVTAAAFLASCASAPPPAPKKRSKEYFSEKKYGVKASPRVVEYGQPVPQGGGRYMVGKPYKVKGRTYRPVENKRYAAVGYASWYGSAFHGRRTANGEVYDMDGLSAAHPTMPLPSYARVTNLRNGSSVVVRVNDRGPYERDRVIDLSAKTADLLDMKHHGSVKVKVEYVGPARMEGHDMRTLMATYVAPGNSEIGNPAPLPRGLRNIPAPVPSSTMVAMRAPSTNPGILLAMAPIPRARPDLGVAIGTPIDPYNYEIQAAQNTVPVAAPVARPAVAQADVGYGGEQSLGTFSVSDPAEFDAYAKPVIVRASASSSYAAAPSRTAAQIAAESLAGGSDGSLKAALERKVERMAAERRADATEIQVGVFSNPANAEEIAARLAPFGRITSTRMPVGGRMMESVRLVVTSGSLSDGEAVAAVVAAGAPGAYILTR